MKMSVLTAVFVMGVALGLAEGASAESWSITSPNGLVKVSVQLADLAGTADYPAGTCLYYRVEQGPEGARATVIKDSPLGLQLQGRDYCHGLRLVDAEPPREIDEAYNASHGKRIRCHNRARHLTLAFANAAGQPLEIDLRAYDDGAAFRYRLPNQEETPQTVENDATGFALPENTRLWMAPSDFADICKPACETNYQNEIALGTPAEFHMGWEFPVLFHTPEGRWGLITESNVDGNFCGTRLTNDAPHGVYRIAWPTAEEGNRRGAVKPSAKLPWEMPWRVVIAGGLNTIVESTLVNDVAAPSKIEDMSWIRPGRVAWSWWSDQGSPRNAEKQCKFVDLAVEMGWEYLLVDANWDIMEKGNISDVLRYAKEKGIGVLLWYNSGGPHNTVTERPRDRLTDRPLRRHELSLLKQWGVKGIKVDFFQSEKQDIIGLYHGIMEDAAAAHLLVNFHGCTIPRGWERTWPNLMAMEAVRGAETYLFDEKYAEIAPTQNAIVPYTRNTIGSMDPTPVAFSDTKFPRRTTYAHELALSVVFESGLLHFADKPEAYLQLPAEPKEFLKHVPVVWDDTRFVAGYPGQYIVLARRRGDVWYIAGINGQNAPREATISLGDWLSPSRYVLTRIADGADAHSFASDVQPIEPGKGFAVKMLPNGGFAATLKPAK